MLVTLAAVAIAQAAALESLIRQGKWEDVEQVVLANPRALIQTRPRADEPFFSLLQKAPFKLVKVSLTKLWETTIFVDRSRVEAILSRYAIYYRNDDEVSELLTLRLISDLCDTGPAMNELVGQGYVKSMRTLGELGLAYSAPDEHGWFAPMHAESPEVLDEALRWCPVNVKTQFYPREPIAHVLARYGRVSVEMLKVLQKHHYDFASTGTFGGTLAEAITKSDRLNKAQKAELLKALPRFQSKAKS